MSYDLQSIKDSQKTKVMENFKESFKLAWYFEKWYEKLILIALVVLGIWKVWGFF